MLAVCHSCEHGHGAETGQARCEILDHAVRPVAPTVRRHGVQRLVIRVDHGSRIEKPMLSGKDVPRAVERFDAGASLPEPGRNVQIPGWRGSGSLGADAGNQAQIGVAPPFVRSNGRKMVARRPTIRPGIRALRRKRRGIGALWRGLIVKRRCCAPVRAFATYEDDSGVLLEPAAFEGAAYVRRGVVQPHPSNHVASPDDKARYVAVAPRPNVPLQCVSPNFVRFRRHVGDVTDRCKNRSEQYDRQFGGASGGRNRRRPARCMRPAGAMIPIAGLVEARHTDCGEVRATVQWARKSLGVGLCGVVGATKLRLDGRCRAP